LNFGERRAGFSLAKSGFCVKKQTDRASKLCQKRVCALVVTTSEKCNYFMFSGALRTKVPFTKSVVITLQVQFACQFGLIDATLHLHSSLGSPLYN